jgi:ectoine hydroxylase-related dioxygenase (phytanoyl-CoA dioxygenase family)
LEQKFDIAFAFGVIEMSSLAAQSAAIPAINLIANGKRLSTLANRMGALVPTDPAIGAQAIRARFEEHGYVWLKGFLQRADIIAFRGWVFSHLSAAGLIEPGSNPMLGLASSGLVEKAVVDRILMALVRSVAFEGFCAQPRLAQFMDEYLDGISYLHKRKIMRFTQPGTTVATPAHYDLVYLRGGTTRIVTAWIPLGDTPVDMGGLVYLEGSHAIGKRMEAEFREKSDGLTAEEQISAYNRNMSEGGWVSKDLPEMAERFDTRWLVAGYEAGDVVLHSPYMIHASTTNQSTERLIRLSTDIRYQNVEDEIDARWANHWSLGDML